MNADDKRKAEVILNSQCVGSEIVGVRWYAHNFFIEIESVPTLSISTHPDLLLTVESRWTVFPARPERVPEREDDLPDVPLEERVAMLARLAGQKIVSAVLGDEHPHLLLTFESGAVFFLNGYHEEYESWNLGTVRAAGGREWLIVALASSRIAVWAPQKTD